MNTTANAAQPVVLDVQGMSCEHCVRAVASALAAVPGIAVRAVTVGYAGVTARDAAAVTAATNAIEQAGYSARARDIGQSPQPVSNGCGCCGTGRCA